MPYSIGIPELFERMVRCVASALREDITDAKLHGEIKNDCRGEEAKDEESSINAIALISFRREGSNGLHYAAILIDYANEWPVTFVLASDQFQLASDRKQPESLSNPLYSEDGTVSIGQFIDEESGKDGIYLSVEKGKGEGAYYVAIDPRQQFVTAV